MTVAAARPAACTAMCTLPAVVEHTLPVMMQTQIAYFDTVLSCSKRTGCTLLSKATQQHNTAQGALTSFNTGPTCDLTSARLPCNSDRRAASSGASAMTADMRCSSVRAPSSRSSLSTVGACAALLANPLACMTCTHCQHALAIIAGHSFSWYAYCFKQMNFQ